MENTPAPRRASLRLPDLAREMAQEINTHAQTDRARLMRTIDQDQRSMAALAELLHEVRLALPGAQDATALLESLLRRADGYIREAGYTIDDYTGQPLTDDLRETLDIVGYRPHDALEDSICETISPQITRGSEVLRRGRVICYSINAKQGEQNTEDKGASPT